ncbi:MAG: class I adenylate-forming enzyme family protein [Ilumatobacteraceae bacterium]|nr:class I adenylate-forming enzyme family protein [Ilumatobacteraceae bacterium]
MKFRDVVDPQVAADYREHGWWGDDCLVDHLRRHVVERPDGVAYIADDGTMSWRQVDDASDRLARVLCAAGNEAGSRVAVILPDSATVHVALLALEKAGIIAVGIGARAGTREIDHLLSTTGARSLVMGDRHRDLSADELLATLDWDGQVVQVPMFEAAPDAPIVVDGEVADQAPDVDFDDRRVRPDDLFMINSTSGTTGLPKCVLHTQNRWMYFHQLAVRNGELGDDEVFMAAVPAPFGFGLWTSHFSPILLGATTVVSRRFNSTTAMEAIARHGVTVLCCVSTQFLMILNDPALGTQNLSSLRVMFTGGEAVPTARAEQFESSTGCCVLQFYGSNETGLLSGTRTTDPSWVRFETAGRIEPDMRVELYDESGSERVQHEGRPAGKGPATCIGYLDTEANQQLFTSDGWMLMGDLCTIDDDGILRVTGRTSDIIIRGGKNISAGQVEDEVCSHPSVALAAAVATPDEIFGERVLVFVELHADAESLSIDDLRSFLLERGTSVELIPEALEVMPELPRSSGAKIAKGELTAIVKARTTPRQ